MKKFLLLTLIAMVTVVSACSSNNAKDNGASPSANTESPSNSEAAETGSSEPAGTEYSLENDGVDQAALDEALSQFPATVPTKIVTTSVPLTEMLHVLGITPIGVPTSTNPIPADFDAVPRIGSPMQPDLEVVTKLEPELLLGAESLRSTLDKSLEGIAIEKAYLKTESFDDLKLSFKALGTYFKKTGEMNAVLTKILNKENELAKQAEGKTLPSVMLMIGTAESFMVMSERSYLGSLVKKLGADNIATSVLKVTDTYSPINMESVVAADPDVILVLASGDHGASEDKFQKEVEKNDAWTKLTAYKNDKIRILDYSTFGVTSINNVEKALGDIAKYFYE
ncbi:ABC transporter substrate-binding protein [Cohnella herbarum]|uniref:ABC transporter substrate-binding protein n=1 Tax=Cohnella herbarum TaxID=2728023 RepID=A0A7Z2VK14_9BACL|nr:ABC transporter substrate-binding protein [Cohnella herbarum]QJD84512.1 ABC transporter substrate-binding protein [Cohnella herbarum]